MKGSRLHHRSFCARSPAHICSPSRLASLPSFNLDCSGLRDVLLRLPAVTRAANRWQYLVSVAGRLVTLRSLAVGWMKQVTCHEDLQPSVLRSLSNLLVLMMKHVCCLHNYCFSIMLCLLNEMIVNNVYAKKQINKDSDISGCYNCSQTNNNVLDIF